MPLRARVSPMDDAFAALQRFDKALRSFDDELRRSMKQIEEHFDSISPIWTDTTRRTFERRWNELRDPIETYVSRDAPAYEHFIDERIKRLRRYLHGR
jgi:hypothetical protein